MYRSPVVVTAALYSLPHAMWAIGLPAKDWINAGTSYELKCKRYLAGMRNGKYKRPLTQIKTEKDAFTYQLKTLSSHFHKSASKADVYTRKKYRKMDHTVKDKLNSQIKTYSRTFQIKSTVIYQFSRL